MLDLDRGIPEDGQASGLAMLLREQRARRPCRRSLRCDPQVVTWRAPWEAPFSGGPAGPMPTPGLRIRTGAACDDRLATGAMVEGHDHQPGMYRRRPPCPLPSLPLPATRRC